MDMRCSITTRQRSCQFKQHTSAKGPVEGPDPHHCTRGK